MKTAVIQFPGSNCDGDALHAAQLLLDQDAQFVWHTEAGLPQGTELVFLPGGFSYGDHLRSGAIAARSPIMQAVKAHAERGGFVLGVCNGFQVLTESGLLPGALSRNRVRLASLSESEIQAYVDTGEPMGKAGGYGIQGRAACFISELHGSYSGVMGLPLYETMQLLAHTQHGRGA